jgi:hypothetical protein
MFVVDGVFVDKGSDDHHLNDGVFKGITVGMRIRMMWSPRRSCLLQSTGVESRHSRCDSLLATAGLNIFNRQLINLQLSKALQSSFATPSVS